jgi:hydrogenase nickel incorporation protein HypB
MSAPVIQHRPHDATSVASRNRDALRAHGILTVALFGGPGCGKTSLISTTIARLTPDVHVGVIACDGGSRRDADRIAGASRQVVQVNAGPGGVVDADHIRDALRWLDLDWLDLLFVEHVGTLPLPGVPDLGQDVTATVFSVAGGDDKADKHPELVHAADVVVLNKVDLIPTVPFDLTAFRADVRRIKPSAELIELSALRADGIGPWVDWLRSRVAPTTASAEKASHWFG